MDSGSKVVGTSYWTDSINELVPCLGDRTDISWSSQICRGETKGGWLFSHRGIRRVSSQGSSRNWDLEMIPGEDLVMWVKCQGADTGLQRLSLPIRRSRDAQALGLIKQHPVPSTSWPPEPILSLKQWIGLTGGISLSWTLHFFYPSTISPFFLFSLRASHPSWPFQLLRGTC